MFLSCRGISGVHGVKQVNKADSVSYAIIHCGRTQILFLYIGF